MDVHDTLHDTNISAVFIPPSGQSDLCTVAGSGALVVCQMLLKGDGALRNSCFTVHVPRYMFHGTCFTVYQNQNRFYSSNASNGHTGICLGLTQN